MKGDDLGKISAIGRLPDLATLLDRAPRFALAHLPTPLERLPGLDKQFPAFRLFIKRDDCTGLALGGNKSRKLEFAVGQALANGATALVTASSLQSNHVRQTAAAAARAGLAFHAIVFPALDSFPRTHLDSGNLLLDGLLGAQLHLASDEASLEAIEAHVVRTLEMQGERPFVIPLGASDGVGALGYVLCAREVLEQCAAQGIAPRAIVTATGSGGTQAGLLAGLRLSGSDLPVIGISVSDEAAVKRDKVRACLAQVGETLGCKIPVNDDEIIVHDAYAGDGYSRPTNEANAWIKTVARQSGVLLDSSYTGKAFAGMADLLQSGAIAPGGDVIFLHTGGIPALFADPRQLWRVERETPEIAALGTQARQQDDSSKSDDMRGEER